MVEISDFLILRFFGLAFLKLAYYTLSKSFGLLSHGIFQDDFRCLIGSLVYQ